MYVQSDTFLLDDVFEKFRNKCFETYELDPGHFLSVQGLYKYDFVWKRLNRIRVYTNIDIPQIVEKETGAGICDAIRQYGKTNNKYTKYYNKNKESSYLT